MTVKEDIQRAIERIFNASKTQNVLALELTQRLVNTMLSFNAIDAETAVCLLNDCIYIYLIKDEKE